MMTWEDPSLASALTAHGIDPTRVSDILAEMERLRLLLDYHLEKPRDNLLSEAEVKSFIVVPLLLALGWEPPQIKMEYHIYQAGKKQHADVLCLSRPFVASHDQATYRADVESSVSLVIETKKAGEILEGALQQAGMYADHLRSGIVYAATNGASWKVKDPADEGYKEFHFQKPTPDNIPILLKLMP